MKKYFVLMLSFVFISSLVLQGCYVANQPYLKNDASEAAPLKVYRIVTPNHRVYSIGGLTATIVVSGVLLGGIGAGLGYVIHNAATIKSSNPEIPDFGKLVTDKFVARAPKEIPNWPAMTIEDKPLDDYYTDRGGNNNYVTDKNFCVLEIKVDEIKIEKNSGLSIQTTVKMKDKDNNVIWEKGYVYDPNKFSRGKNYESLKADNYKLLKEEYNYASEMTVTDFIIHFKNSLPSTKKQG
jgi:hypothetical protein